MTRTLFRTLTTLSLAALMTIAAQAKSPADKLSNVLTAEEIRVLTTKASTPADHTVIANYYRAKADEYQAEAQVHARMLAAYKADVTKVSTKNYATTVGHCETLVRDLQQKAAESQKLAEAQEQLAGAQQPTAPPSHDMSGMKMDGSQPMHDCCCDKAQGSCCGKMHDSCCGKK